MLRFCVRAFLVLLTVFLPMLTAVVADAARVPIRFTEGLTRGFLVLRALDRRILAHGDLIQVVHGHRVESRMVFHFKDGSIFDERVVFSQNDVLTLLSYRLTQRGPSFPDTLDIVLDAQNGRYAVTSGTGTSAKVSKGQMTLPDDVYNGMAITVLKNLPPGTSRTIHMVAFTPKPRLIELEIAPSGQQEVQMAEASKSVARYRLHPQLGSFLGFFASLLGRTPPDYECLIFNADVPAFVRCDGPLAVGGATWRIELTNAR